MQREVKMWMLMYTDWLVGQLNSGEESFLIPGSMYQKYNAYEAEIAKTLHFLPEVETVAIEDGGIRVILQ